MARRIDAVVVGSGPNGLAAAITLARAGLEVIVLEGQEQAGGGLRSESSGPGGFVHDRFAAVFPLGVASPFFKSLPQGTLGIEWVEGDAPLAHVLDDGGVVVAEHDLAATAAGLGTDRAAYVELMRPLVRDWQRLVAATLAPPVRWLWHPVLLSRFARRALLPAVALAYSKFKTEPARALLIGIAAHAALPLDGRLSAAPGLLLGTTAHGGGWPIVRGGSQRLADALATHLQTLGGRIETARPVRSLDDLPEARLRLLDVSARQFVSIAGDRLHGSYRRRLLEFRRGPGVFKLDYRLSGPVPWRDAACLRAPTVHLGGGALEVSAAEDSVMRGRVAERPFVIVVQPTVFDPSRAPAGQHTLWAYCHVPGGCDVDVTERIEGEIERSAPGFRDRVITRKATSPGELERENWSLEGGDFSGGSVAGLQLLFRPVRSINPYGTPVPGTFLCSASTPPGPGVHGMCGYWAARAALGTLMRPGDGVRGAGA